MNEIDNEPETSEPDKRKTLRRKEDRDRCAWCSFLWENHDKEKAEHRELVCAKIDRLTTLHVTETKEMRDNFKGMVPWKAFAIVITILLALSAGVNAVIGTSVKDGQNLLRHDLDLRMEEAKRSLDSIHRRISTSDDEQQKSLHLVNEKLAKIETSSSVLEWRMGEVEKKMNSPQPRTGR